MTPRWCAVGLVAGALLITSCATSSRGAAPTATRLAPQGSSPPSTPASGGTPLRWGHDTRTSTGGHDRQPQFMALPAGYRIETYATGLTRPTSMAFTPDGRLLVAQQSGAIRVVENGRLRTRPFYVANVYYPEPEDRVIELGLVGIAVDPDFEDNGHVYIYYTTKAPKQQTVLARIRDSGAGAGNLTEIFALDAAPDCCHISGSLRFAADGTLFVTVGDHQMEAEAQNPASPFGSVLRINPDGSAPADNPFVGVAGADERVYAYGLRNPFDLAIDPATRRIFASENGFIGQDALIEVKAGANYGWPGSGLAVPREQVEEPLIFYHEPHGLSGMEFYASEALPALTGTLLFCQFHQGGALHAVSFGSDGSVLGDRILALGCTTDVVTGPDGFIYFADYVSGTIYRIARDGGR